MSDVRTAVTGVILAGGMGRRMNGVDKGLVVLQQQEMIGWVVDILKPNVSEVIINANRNTSDYEKFAASVVKDSIDGFQGPLAGFEAGMSAANTEWVFTLSLIHISEPTRQEAISYAVFCLKKKN